MPSPRAPWQLTQAATPWAVPWVAICRPASVLAFCANAGVPRAAANQNSVAADLWVGPFGLGEWSFNFCALFDDICCSDMPAKLKNLAVANASSGHSLVRVPTLRCRTASASSPGFSGARTDRCLYGTVPGSQGVFSYLQCLHPHCAQAAQLGVSDLPVAMARQKAGAISRGLTSPSARCPRHP